MIGWGSRLDLLDDLPFPLGMDTCLSFFLLKLNRGLGMKGVLAKGPSKQGREKEPFSQAFLFCEVFDLSVFLHGFLSLSFFHV